MGSSFPSLPTHHRFRHPFTHTSCHPPQYPTIPSLSAHPTMNCYISALSFVHLLFHLLFLNLVLRNLILFFRGNLTHATAPKEQLMLNQTCHSLHCTVPAQGCWRAAKLGSVCFSQLLSCGRWWTWREAGNWKMPGSGTETTTYRDSQDSPLIKHGPHS